MSSDKIGNKNLFYNQMDSNYHSNDDPLFSSYLNSNFTDATRNDNNDNLLIDGEIDILMGDEPDGKVNNSKNESNHVNNSFLINNAVQFDGILDLPDLMVNNDSEHQFSNFDSFLQNGTKNSTETNKLLDSNDELDISISAKSNTTLTGKSIDSNKPKRKYIKKKPSKAKETSSEDVDFFFNNNTVPVPIQGTSLITEMIPDLEKTHGNGKISKSNPKVFDSMLEILPDDLDLMNDMSKQNDQAGIGQNEDFKNTSASIKINGNMQNGEIANFWAFNVEDFLSQPSSLGSTTISAPNSTNSQSLGNNNSIGGFGKPNVLELTKQAATRRGSVASNNGKSQTHSFKTQQVVTSSTSKNDNKLPQQCFNCKTYKTPLWRRDLDGNTLCNACGLFHKLHGTMRPLSLKSDVIRKRNTKKKEKDASTGNIADSSVNGSKSRKSSVVSLSNNEFIGLNGSKKESNKNKNISSSAKPITHPSLGRKESSSSSLSAMKNKGGVYSSMLSQSLPAQNNVQIKSRRSSSSSGSSNTSSKINIPILPKKNLSISGSTNNKNINSSVLMSTSHPNYNNGNGAQFLSGGSFMENSPRFTQGSVVSLSPFAGINGIDTTYSAVSTPSELNTPTLSSNLHKLTNSNNSGHNFYNNTFISQVPSTTISNSNVLSLNGKMIQQQPTMPVRTPGHSFTNNASTVNNNSFKQHGMAGPYNNNNSMLNNNFSTSLSNSNVSLLSQQLQKPNFTNERKVNPHDVSGMYNSLYGSNAGANQGFLGFKEPDDNLRSSHSQNSTNSGGEDLSWLKFGM